MRLRCSCQTPHDRCTIDLLRSGDFHVSLAILLSLFDLYPNRDALLIASRPDFCLRAAAVLIAGQQSLLERSQEVLEIARWACCRLVAQVAFQLCAQLCSCEKLQAFELQCSRVAEIADRSTWDVRRCDGCRRQLIRPSAVHGCDERQQ